MPRWAIMRVLEQAALARKDKDYLNARKWLSYARAMRIIGDFYYSPATAPVARSPLPDQTKAIRQLEKARRHGMSYSMSKGSFFHILMRKVPK